MVRAIDAEEVMNKMQEGYDEAYGTERAIWLKAMGKIKELPTIDPVIRCRDCAVPHNKWTGCPKLNGLVPPDNFYCAFGVRRGDDGKDD